MDCPAQSPFFVRDSGKYGTILAHKKFFEQACVMTVAGKYSKYFYVSVQPAEEGEVSLTFSSKDGTPIEEFFLKEVMNSLIDQQIRLDLQKEFGGIRDKIITYAFSFSENLNV